MVRGVLRGRTVMVSEANGLRDARRRALSLRHAAVQRVLVHRVAGGFAVLAIGRLPTDAVRRRRAVAGHDLAACARPDQLPTRQLDVGRVRVDDLAG
eukprot:scaffold20693_cov76-Phaeocystis_antarctica.AAC.5